MFPAQNLNLGMVPQDLTQKLGELVNIGYPSFLRVLLIYIPWVS